MEKQENDVKYRKTRKKINEETRKLKQGTKIADVSNI